MVNWETEQLLIAIPKQVESSGVYSVAAGEYHSFYLKSDGSILGMGYNGHGQLGSISNLSPLLCLKTVDQL